MLFHQSSIPMPVDALSAINLHASCWPVESTSMSLETGSLARMRVSRRSSIPSAWPEDQPELWGPVWSLQEPMGHGAAMGQWTEWTLSGTTAPCSCSWVGSAGTFPLSGSLRSQHHGLDASPRQRWATHACTNHRLPKLPSADRLGWSGRACQFHKEHRREKVMRSIP